MFSRDHAMSRDRGAVGLSLAFEARTARGRACVAVLEDAGGSRRWRHPAPPAAKSALKFPIDPPQKRGITPDLLRCYP
jgi:hypothetical protein